jgi:hypothetical protein
MEYYSVFKKEGHSDTCNNVEGTWGHSAQWNEQTQKDTHQDATHRRSPESQRHRDRKGAGAGEGKEVSV